MKLLSIFRYSLMYAIVLTLWSLSIVVSDTYFHSRFNGVLGIVVLALIYFYLSWSLKRLYSGTEDSKMVIVISGVFITAFGCALSSATLGLYNVYLGLANRFSNSVRAVIVQAILALITSLYLANKIRPVSMDNK